MSKADLLQATIQLAERPCSSFAFRADVVEALLATGIAEPAGGLLRITGWGRAFLAAVAVRPGEVLS